MGGEILDIRPLSGALGAEIAGVDLAQALDDGPQGDETLAEIRRAGRCAPMKRVNINDLWLSNSGLSVKHSRTLCPAPGTRLSPKS